MTAPAQCPRCSGVSGRHTMICDESLGLRPADRPWTCNGCWTDVVGPRHDVDGEPRCAGCACHAAIGATS